MLTADTGKNSQCSELTMTWSFSVDNFTTSPTDVIGNVRRFHLPATCSKNCQLFCYNTIQRYLCELLFATAEVGQFPQWCCTAKCMHAWTSGSYNDSEIQTHDAHNLLQWGHRGPVLLKTLASRWYLKGAPASRGKPSRLARVTTNRKFTICSRVYVSMCSLPTWYALKIKSNNKTVTKHLKYLTSSYHEMVSGFSWSYSSGYDGNFSNCKLWLAVAGSWHDSHTDRMLRVCNTHCRELP